MNCSATPACFVLLWTGHPKVKCLSSTTSHYITHTLLHCSENLQTCQHHRAEKGRWLFQSCKHTSSYLWGVQAQFAPGPAAAYVALPCGLHSDPPVDMPALLRLFSTWSAPEEWSQETESTERKRHECILKKLQITKRRWAILPAVHSCSRTEENSSELAVLQGFHFLRREPMMLQQFKHHGSLWGFTRAFIMMLHAFSVPASSPITVCSSQPSADITTSQNHSTHGFTR